MPAGEPDLLIDFMQRHTDGERLGLRQIDRDVVLVDELFGNSLGAVESRPQPLASNTAKIRAAQTATLVLVMKNLTDMLG